MFEVDMRRVPDCAGGAVQSIAAIPERPVIEKLLTRRRLQPQPKASVHEPLPSATD